MDKKLNQITLAWSQGDRLGALRLASKSPHLGKERDAIQRGWSSYRNPVIYRQMGYDPQQLLREAFDALQRRYQV